MVKKTKTKVYDTEKATLVKKFTCGVWGDSKGYEETLYQTAEGDYFIYTNGGKDSLYPKENIASCTKANATKFIAEK